MGASAPPPLYEALGVIIVPSVVLLLHSRVASRYDLVRGCRDIIACACIQAAHPLACACILSYSTRSHAVHLLHVVITL